ncbi:MAG: hypothetical protein Kow0037_26230 [Calditrichia bacterium]
MVMMSDRVVRLNNFIQFYLERNNLEMIPLNMAAKLLSERGILQDSTSSPGFPLRRHVLNGTLLGAEKTANGRWWVHRIDDYSPLVSAERLARLMGLRFTSSIYRKFRSEKIPYLRFSRRGICFRLDHLLNWANESENEELYRKLSNLQIED